MPQRWGVLSFMGSSPKRISKEGIATAMRRRHAASGSGMAMAAADRATAFACAVIISKKVAVLATTRNRLRRRVREALRRISKNAGQPFACVVVIRAPNIPNRQALEAALVELLRESGILIR